MVLKVELICCSNLYVKYNTPLGIAAACAHGEANSVSSVVEIFVVILFFELVRFSNREYLQNETVGCGVK